MVISVFVVSDNRFLDKKLYYYTWGEVTSHICGRNTIAILWGGEHRRTVRT